MPTPLAVSERTLLASLAASAALEIDDELPDNGSFLTRRVSTKDGVERDYVYYQGYRTTSNASSKPRRYTRYLGLTTDPAVTVRVERFNATKATRRERASLVAALTALGLPSPSKHSGRTIEALSKTGIFNQCAVLLGAEAYGTYPALVGMRLKKTETALRKASRNGNHPIRLAVEGHSKFQTTLQRLEPTLHEVIAPARKDRVTYFEGNGGTLIHVATTHATSVTYNNDPWMRENASEAEYSAETTSDICHPNVVTMASITPGRSKIRPNNEPALDPLAFLIRDAVPTTVLHGPGIPVTVPTPARCAVYQLLALHQSSDGQAVTSSADFTPDQLNELILALLDQGGSEDFHDAIQEAATTHPGWKNAILTAGDFLQATAAAALRSIAATSVGAPDQRATLTGRQSTIGKTQGKQSENQRETAT